METTEPHTTQLLSPIEEAFSKLKAFLRWVGARTPETLQEALGQALLTITVQDAHGWFGHCGYRSVARGYVRKLNVNLTEVSESVIIMNEYKFI